MTLVVVVVTELPDAGEHGLLVVPTRSLVIRDGVFTTSMGIAFDIRNMGDL